MNDKDDLKTRFLSDLSLLGLPVYEVDVEFRDYSKTYYGRYYPSYNELFVNPKVVMYPYEIDGSFMDYDVLLCQGIHEFCHHIQYVSGSYVRRVGRMHDTQFWRLYNYYVNKAYELGVLGGEVLAEVR